MTRLPGSSPLAIMTLREVRAAGAAGAGLVAFDLGLDQVLWANRAGRSQLGLQAGDGAFPSTSVAARQIKASARLIETWGEARILVRSTIGRSSKALVATLQRIDSAQIVLMTLPDLVPAASSESALADRLLEDSGLDRAAVYGPAGPLATTTGFQLVEGAVLVDAVAGLLRSAEDQAQIDLPSARMTMGAVAADLVLVLQEDLPAPQASPTPEALPADLPGSRPPGFFSARRRRLSTDRGRMSMTGLLQRWHIRQNGDDAAAFEDPDAGDGAALPETPEAANAPVEDRDAAARVPAAFAPEVGEGRADAAPAGISDVLPTRHPSSELELSSDADARTTAPAEAEPHHADSQASEPLPAKSPATSVEAQHDDGPATVPTADDAAPAVHSPPAEDMDAPSAAAEAPVPTATLPAPGPETPAEETNPGSLPALASMPDAGHGGAEAPQANGDWAAASAEALGEAAEGPAHADGVPAEDAAPAASAPVATPGEPAPAFMPRFDIAPVRFVWQIDRDGKFRSLTPEFSAAVGPAAADVAGRSFREVAAVFGFDAGGEIARLLDRRDTWSGRSILWPVEGSNRKVPVDLAALPIYARDRSFDGFRGFGIVRMNESVEDAEAIGLILGERQSLADCVTEKSETPSDAAPDAAPASDGPVESASKKPLLTTFEAQAFGRRQVSPLPPEPVEAPAAEDVPKVIRLEERRRPREGALSQAEEAAFRAIGVKLGERPTAPTEATADAEAAAHLLADSPTTDAEALLSTTPDSAPVEDSAAPADAVSAPADLFAADVPSTIAPDTTAADADAPVSDTEAPVVAATAERGKSTVASPWASDLPTLTVPDRDAPRPPSEDAPVPAAEVPAHPVQVSDAQDAAPKAVDAPDLDAMDEAEEEPGALAAAIEAVFASLPLPVLAEAHGTLVYANREFQDLTGYETIEALEASGGLDSLFTDRTDPLQTGQLSIRRANGQLLDVRVHMQRATFSGRSFLLMSFTPSPRDAASSPLLEEEEVEGWSEAADLRQQVEELQAVLDTATDGVVLLDPAGMIRAMNGSAHALFGIGQDDHSGRHLSSLFAHESQKATLDYLDMLRDDGLAGIMNDGREVIGRVAQGGFIPLFITIGRLSGERGWCVVIRDIAHWKRIEEDLVNARRQAEAASLHKSRFLANISHELRTPLNAIIGFADVMASECFGPIGNERYLEYLGDIKRSGHHVLDLVNDLLDISKIEAGKLELAFEAVSLNEVVSEVVSLMQPQANRERVIVRSNLPSSVPPVVADRRTMRQIALNLVANAIRFTPAGGQIIASTTYTADGDVLLRFRDSGIGMTEREIEIALTPFQQVHAPSANRGEGTGLGLPLTKAMVEANRAQFAITSAPNEGTLVEISFPSQRVLAD